MKALDLKMTGDTMDNQTRFNLLHQQIIQADKENKSVDGLVKQQNS